MASQPYASDAEIADLVRGLLDRSLPKSQWTHGAHFASTLWLMRHRPDLVLARDLAPIIRSYNEAVGGMNTDTQGYHETITQASLHVARTFLDGRPAQEPIHQVVAALMASPMGRSDWLLNHWSPARLFCVQARRSWCEPDIAPL